MKIKKVINWPQQVAATIKAATVRPFSWGELDCCLFAAEVVKAQTGTDLSADYRGRYSTELGAARVLKKLGGIDALLDQHFERVPFSQVQRGDVLQFDGPYGLTLGVFFGAIWAPTATGVAPVDIIPLTVWRI